MSGKLTKEQVQMAFDYSCIKANLIPFFQKPEEEKFIAELVICLNDILGKPRKKREITTTDSVGQRLVAFYIESYEKKFGHRPTILPQDGRALKILGESTSFEKACDIISAYLSMKDSWFLKKAYDVDTLMRNRASIVRFMENGITITNSELKSIDQAITNKHTLEELQKGKV